MSHGVEIGVKTERLAQGTRGVFLLRSSDGDPHQVRLSEPRLRGGNLPGEGHTIAFDPLTLDLQPGRDLVVPFDVKTGEVPRGTYALSAVVVVDGFEASDTVDTEVRVR